MVPEGKVPVDKVSPVPRDTGTLDIFTANTIRFLFEILRPSRERNEAPPKVT